MKTLALSLLSCFALAAAGCKKEAEPAPSAPPVDPAATGDTRADVEPDADYVRILATHEQPKPTDPVIVSLTRFAVVAAAFDPDAIEGGTATLELDLASLESGSVKRDNHLRSADYLDVDNHAKATIRIGNVVRQQGDAYAADAAVTVRGQERTFPVTFTVLERRPTAIRVKGEHTFSRHELGIGKAEGEEDSVGRDLTIELLLTIAKTT
jgi:polyisoprenoid-binding protein YceI